VAFVTQGELSNLPWHALPLTDRGATLGDVVDVVEVPSGTILTHLMRQPPRAVRKAVLVACDPFRQLSDHFREVREAFASLEVEERVILTDRSRPVTVSAVLSELRDADVFHFAGHGVGSAGDPEQSGLALSDGLLSVGIIERALAGRAPRIVMLSACRTAEGGAGAAGQVPNLLTAMIGAGATAGIGSLWDVPDHVASRTTDELYQRLTRDGAVRALCEARRVLARASHAARLADPERNAAAEYAWAAFKLVGWD
jgi:CHAT domain-containing protein